MTGSNCDPFDSGDGRAEDPAVATWTSKDGAVRQIAEMTVEHIDNTILLVRARYEQHRRDMQPSYYVGGHVYVQNIEEFAPAYPALIAERRKRRRALKAKETA